MADKAEFLQAINEAILDADSLERFINGDDTQDVLTRLSKRYPTLQKAIKELFENGGLPATPFKTKALMTASALADGDYAQVTDDTVNNGLYVKTAGAWVKSGYDPLTQSNTYTDKAAADAVSEALAHNLATGKDLEIAVDNQGLAYRRVDSTGKEFLAHLDRSVQDEIAIRTSGIAATAYAGDIEQLLDADNNVVSRTDKRGGFYIASGGSSVQHFLREAIADPYKKSDFNAPIKNPRETYSAEIKALVANLQQDCLPYIEPPLLLVPNNLNIPDSVLSVITTSDDNSVGQLQFPNTLGGSAHPYALQLRKPLYGYKGLLLDSNHKYGSEGDENPVMFGTNDWNKFELVPDVQQPMWHPAVGEEGRTRDSYLSDPWFAYDPTDGGLIWGTRESYKYGTKETYFCMTKTYDGVRWTERKKVLNATQVTGNSDKSPAMLYNPIDGLWHLWTVVNEGVLTHYTSNNYLGNWTKISEHNFNTSHNFVIWHIEVKFVGSKYALCASSRGDNSQVYLGFSDDGDTWVLSKGIVEPQSKGIYKPTFNVEFRDDGSYRFVFIWSHWNFGAPDYNKGDTQQLYVQPTQWLNA